MLQSVKSPGVWFAFFTVSWKLKEGGGCQMGMFSLSLTQDKQSQAVIATHLLPGHLHASWFNVVTCQTQGCQDNS